MEVNIKRKMLMLLWLLSLTVSVRSQDPAPPVYRLPDTVTPTQYVIRLAPDIDSGLVNGTIIIYLKTTSNTNVTFSEIVLHMGSKVSINETSALLLDSDGVIQTFGAVDSDDDNTLVRLKMPDGQLLKYNHFYVMTLNFQSWLNTEPKGLFYGYYNATSKYIASNFRPTHAREVFPCFDEPQFRVPITLQILRPNSYTVLSTAHLDSSYSYSSDLMMDEFSTTQPISIHSLGLFISQQVPVSSMGVNVIVPPGMPASVGYLNTIISTVSTKLGSFATSPLNLVVLPDKVLTSFSSFGFVYLSPDIYLGEVGSPLQWTGHKLRLTEEFIKQYLEYLKSPVWWSDLWLTESIGAYLAIQFQEDEPWLNDWLRIMVRSEALGAYNTTTPPIVSSQPLAKWDIENLISNSSVKVKGLSTLLMWSDTMPEGLVDKTLQDFLDLSQTLVNTSDLVNLMVRNIKENTTYDVTPTIDLLPSWLISFGSPFISFSEDPSAQTFTLIQETSCSVGSSPDSPIYPISVAIPTFDGNTSDWTTYRQGRWLLNSSDQFKYDPTYSAWTVINIESAPFRVNYEPSHWLNLTGSSFLASVPLSVISNLQDDAIALALNGCLDFSTALFVLNNTQHLGLGWYPVIKAAEAITEKIGNDWSALESFGLFFQSLFTADLLSQLDVRNSSKYQNLQITRELVTPWLCRFNIGSCREGIVEVAGPLWQGNTSMIDGSDMVNVACYGARYTPGALEPLLTAYKSASTPTLRYLYTVALSCLTETTSVQRLLALIVNDTESVSISSRAVAEGSSWAPQPGVDFRDNFEEMASGENDTPTLTPSDAQQIIIGLSASAENSEAVLDVLIQQSLDLQLKFGVGTVSTVIKNLAKSRTDLSRLASLEQSLDLNPYVIQSANEAISRSNSSAAWWTQYGSQLMAALPAPPLTSTSTTTTTSTPVTPTTTTTPVTHISTSTLVPPTTTSTPVSHISTTTTVTPNSTTTPKPGPAPTSTSTTAQPPSSAPSVFDLRVLVLVFSALLVVL